MLLTIIVVCSCRDNNPEKSQTTPSTDSLSLNIGVYPSLDALPMMLANEWGILDSLGVSATIHVYRSQIDAEKALATDLVDVAMSDMFRVAWWQWQKKPMRFAFVTRREMNIVPNKALRMTNINQLDDRMIAMSRFSLDDYYCDEVEKLMTKKRGQVLRPQINSVELRCKMLLSGQLDAAVLTQMQTYKADLSGYKAMDVKAGVRDGFAGYAFNTNSLMIREKHKQMVLLNVAYNIVVNRLRDNKGRMPEISKETQEALFLDDNVLKVMRPLKDFILAQDPNIGFVDASVAWLKKRSAVNSGFGGDTLLVEK